MNTDDHDIARQQSQVPTEPAQSDGQDDRSAMAKAMDVASRVTTASLSMAAPPFVGYLIDNRLGTWVLFTVLGLFFGMAAGIYQLVKLANSTDNNESES